MRLDSKRSQGLRGVAALLFIALAGGGAYAFARRDSGPSPATEAVAPVVTAARLAASRSTTCENKPLETKPSQARPAEANPAEGKRGPGSAPADEAREGLLALRQLAKSRTASPAQSAAKEKL